MPLQYVKDNKKLTKSRHRLEQDVLAWYGSVVTEQRKKLRDLASSIQASCLEHGAVSSPDDAEGNRHQGLE